MEPRALDYIPVYGAFDPRSRSSLLKAGEPVQVYDYRGCRSISGVTRTRASRRRNGWPAQSWRASFTRASWHQHRQPWLDEARNRRARRRREPILAAVSVCPGSTGCSGRRPGGRRARRRRVNGDDGTRNCRRSWRPKWGRPPGHAPVIVDARTLPSGTEIETDVCIVGAGPSGVATLPASYSAAEFGRACSRTAGRERPGARSFCSAGRASDTRIPARHFGRERVRRQLSSLGSVLARQAAGRYRLRGPGGDPASPAGLSHAATSFRTTSGQSGTSV